MKKLTIYDYTSEKDEHHTLSVEINDNSDLVLEGYDCGQSVKDFFGDFDYEYWLTVKSENVHEVLLQLIKDRFKSDSEFKHWLEEKDIKYDFFSYI